ncbi:MAG TPA: site-2 protease family protein [Patescibacteria group bacterium]|nr:site-2 protease family protein [Patescibacteria group bacterium]
MTNFMIYDIVLLIIFVLIVSVFLFRKRKNLKREGMLLLYRTVHGISAINKIGNKYKKTLKVLGYVSITLGYILMGSIIYLFGKIIWIYIFQPNVVRAIKVPPITPLIPYLPQIFNLNLPPFYFTYWIIIIAVVAVIHEFSHGIFAAYSKVKIKKTGFGFFPFFFPVFLAAFVELDEKNMEKKKKINQLAILSAGTFANVLTAVFFFFVLWGFFSLSFAPAGVTFDTYSYTLQNISAISSVNGISVNSPSYADISKLTNGTTGLDKVNIGNQTFFITNDFLQSQQNVKNYILLYDDSPAIKANLTGAITEIGGSKILSTAQLASQLMKYKPGDSIVIETKTSDNAIHDYNIVLGQNPENKNIPYLGIGFNLVQTTGLSGAINSVVNFMKQPNVYYEARYNAAEFIYDLLWWLVLICVSVALVNMLPMGIFDGGRFFMLTVWGITKNRKIAEKAFKFVTFLFIFLVIALMVFWAIGVFGK